MSCSQFIEHEDEDKSDTLVIIVNGDGTVNVDPRTLERVLKHQVRAAVSVVKLEESDEPDSQTEKLKAERNEKPSDEKDSFCHKVNLVVEGYYPPPPLNSKNMSSDSVVSSTVGTPPLPQTPAEFLDLLAEGLEIPVTQSNEGCIGDSLVDAFSEMAPEQLKQVETALHSEKAKQILGDGVTSVLDTLKLGDDNDDWVHIDHCYTANYYGNRKPQRTEQNTIEKSESSMLESDISTIEEIYETLSDMENVQKTNVGKKKTDVEDKNAASSKKIVLGDVKTLINSIKEKRSPIHIISKVKKKTSKSDPEPPPERIVKEDEVDGVKVFKPTKLDKRIMPKFSSKDSAALKAQLVQTKLNFGPKKEDASSSIKKPITPTNDSEISTPKQVNKNGTPATKKDATRKPVTPEIFGPALFSTPDIIRKIGDDTSKGNCSASTIDTADLEKRMSAIENGELLDNITLPYVQSQSEKVEDRIHVQDDDRLLSDLENSADEFTQAEEIVVGLSSTLSDLDSPRKKSAESEQSDFSDKNDAEYEDDPNKLWCICNKPHNNRFMICCDACDNWFHGYCVSITKAMGEKMEQNGTEWLCPSCKKEKTTTERDSKQKLPTRNVANRNTPSNKRRSSQICAESTNSSVSINSTSVETSPLSQNTSIERFSTNQATPGSANRRKSSCLPSKPSTQLCIMCQENEALPEGLYCTNACIVRYVAAAIEKMNSSLPEPLPDDQKIIVHDKKRDHKITGMRAPSIRELTRWLADHPSFEIIKPSAFPIRPDREVKLAAKPTNDAPKTPVAKTKDQANITVSNKPKLQTQNSKTMKIMNTVESSQTSIKSFLTEKIKIKKSMDSAGNVIVQESSSQKLSEQKKDVQMKMKEKDRQRPIKLIPPQPKPVAEEVKPASGTIAKQPIASKPSTPIPVTKKPLVQTSPASEKTEKTAIKRKAEPPKKEKPPAKKPVEVKRQDSKKSEDSTPSEAPAVVGVTERERIRKSCREALGELFTSRMKDVTDIKVPAEELTILAKQVEEELFNLFNDTNTKYKSKYRSLRFNIKDEKNTLFRRIAEKSLRPRDLVRLTPEEMASTELAQWREREAKHELDMIKKTELENLSQAKVLVLKTHKGDFEIEAGALPMPDTVVPDLHPDELPVEADRSKKSLSQLSSKLKLSSKDKKSSTDMNKSDRDKSRHKKHDHRDKHKSSHKHRHRSRSRRRSRSKEGKESGKSGSEKKDRSSRSSADKKHDSRNSSDKDRHRSRSDRHRSRSHSHRKDKTPEKKDDASTSAETMEPTPTKNESPLLESSQENTIILDKEDAKIAAEILSSYNPVDVDLSDMEPTSTVTIQTPPYATSPELPSFVWKGTLIMPDVIKLHVRLKEVSGNCDGLDEDLPGVIDCVGRINPNTVWEYISKTKKSGSKEILVLRFEPVDDEQRANYLALYSYLNRKDRMAVVGSTSPSIKDFYVIPLAGHSPIPQVLLPLDGPGFEESRSHMLLGVIVRGRRLGHHSAASLLTSSYSSSKKEKETYLPSITSYSIENQTLAQNDTFTPPHSPTSVLIGGPPALPPVSIPANDDDEPYSPEDDEPYSPGALDEEHENDSSLGMHREMDAINREIEVQMQQIESISSSLPQDEPVELYSPTENFNVDSDMSTVQLPGDLQQLLNSLNRRTSDGTVSGSALPVDPIVDAYKQHAESSEDEEEEEQEEEVEDEEEEEDEDDDEEEEREEIEGEPELPPHFSPPDAQIEESDDEVEETVPEITPVSEIPTPVDIVEHVDDSRLSRDPRRKPAPVITPSAVEPFRMLPGSQPPPPGMEDEFSLGSTGVTPTKTDVAVTMVTTTVADAAYVTAVPTTPYVYHPPITAYPPPNMLPTVPPMYIPPPGVFPQTAAMPFATIPTQPMYISTGAVLPSDPSMIPLPVEPIERKRKSQEDDRDTDRRSGRKHYRDSKSPPGRDSYDSHHRNYRRDDDRDSRYGHNRHDRNYRNRSGYWKSCSDYSSSSSSSRRKYSDRDRDRDRRSDSRERSSSSKRSSRWDDEKFESRKRDKSDRKSESSSK